MPCSSQALYGITRQNPAAMSAVMEGFMAKIESVHPLLTKDAVRREVNEMPWMQTISDGYVNSARDARKQFDQASSDTNPFNVRRPSGTMASCFSAPQTGTAFQAILSS